jgi:hypothetical protein
LEGSLATWAVTPALSSFLFDYIPIAAADDVKVGGHYSFSWSSGRWRLFSFFFPNPESGANN